MSLSLAEKARRYKENPSPQRTKALAYYYANREEILAFGKEKRRITREEKLVQSKIERIYLQIAKRMDLAGYRDIPRVRAAFVAGVDSVLCALAEGEKLEDVEAASNRIEARMV